MHLIMHAELVARKFKKNVCLLAVAAVAVEYCVEHLFPIIALKITICMHVQHNVGQVIGVCILCML